MRVKDSQKWRSHTAVLGAPADATPRVRNAILHQGFGLEPPGVVRMKLHRAGAAARPPLHPLRVQHPTTDVRHSAERHEGDEAPARGRAAVRDLEVLCARVRLCPHSGVSSARLVSDSKRAHRVAEWPASRSLPTGSLRDLCQRCLIYSVASG